jgi:RNA polymerase sigma factor (sigma-70 family)
MDDREFADLLDRYAPLVCSIAVRYGLKADEVDDVYCETVTWGWEHRHESRSREHFPRWLASVARFKTLEHIRARRRSGVPIEHVAEPVDEGRLPEDLAILAEDLARLFDALEKLTPKQRVLVERLFLSPRRVSYADIAAELGVSVGSLGRMRQRALTRLRRLLGEVSTAPEGGAEPEDGPPDPGRPPPPD